MGWLHFPAGGGHGGAQGPTYILPYIPELGVEARIHILVDGTATGGSYTLHLTDGVEIDATIQWDDDLAAMAAAFDPSGWTFVTTHSTASDYVLQRDAPGVTGDNPITLVSNDLIGDPQPEVPIEFFREGVNIDPSVPDDHAWLVRTPTAEDASRSEAALFYRVAGQWEPVGLTRWDTDDYLRSALAPGIDEYQLFHADENSVDRALLDLSTSGAQLNVSDATGNFLAGINISADGVVLNPAILISEDSALHRLVVADDGTLSTEAL